MNKYKVTSQVNEDFIDTEVEADAVDTLPQTGQIIFYNTTEDGHETVAIFPATCAVIKLEDEQEVFEKAKKEIEDRYISGTYEVPAGNANTVFNEPLL